MEKKLNEGDIERMLQKKKTNITSGLFAVIFFTTLEFFVFIHDNIAGAFGIIFLIFVLILSIFIPISKNRAIDEELKIGGKKSYLTKYISYYERRKAGSSMGSSTDYYIVLDEPKLNDYYISNPDFFNDVKIGDELFIEIGIKSNEILCFQLQGKDLTKYHPLESSFKNGKV